MTVFLIVVGVAAVIWAPVLYGPVVRGWRAYRSRDRRQRIDLDRPGRLANLLEIERRQNRDAGK